MSLSRILAIVAVIGLVLGALVTVRNPSSTLAESGAAAHANAAAPILKLHDRQDLATEKNLYEARLSARWAALDEAYSNHYSLLTTEQTDRIKAYWAAADAAYRRQFDLLSSGTMEGQKAHWAALEEAYRLHFGFPTLEQSNRQGAYWAALEGAYRMRYGLPTVEQSNRQKAYWAAIDDAYRKLYGPVVESGQ